LEEKRDRMVSPNGIEFRIQKGGWFYMVPQGEMRILPASCS
jgi:hypothetical protein